MLVTPSASERSKYGRGWIRDKHDTEKDLRSHVLFGARRPGVFAGASLEQFVDFARDQKQTSSCTGFAFGRAAHVRCAKMGTPIPWPSTTGIYVCGLAEERKQLGFTPEEMPLVDKGAQPTLVNLGLSEWGVASDIAWPPGGFLANYKGDKPEEHAFITAEPDFEELLAASTFVRQGSYRIASLDSERVLDTCQALENGYPVAIGVEVDAAFENFTGGSIVTAPNPKGYLGGHMLCIVGYRQNSMGKKEFRVVNSWGTGWGEQGLFWADESWLCDPAADDLLVMTVNAATGN